MTPKVDKILRIFCNSPNDDDKDFKSEWLVNVAKICWSAADR